VVDPVDGTYNFANGNPRFGVIVALVIDGVTVMGWIHDPLPDVTVFARAGQGAWQGDERLIMPPARPLAEMRGAAPRRAALASRVAQVCRTGSAAHDYLDLVHGRLDFAHYRKLMPWDHAAGVLIHAEAGGHSALDDGAPYRPMALPGHQLLLAADRAAWSALHDLVG
jgi:fructose-1,6-bisphosphatase/inositol monophosphatase family enzyme